MDEQQQRVKDWMARYAIPAYDEKARSGLVRHVFVRTDRSGRSLCCLLVNGRGIPGRPNWSPPCGRPSRALLASSWG